MKALKNFVMTLAILLLTVVLAGLVVFGLASSDVNDDVFNEQPSDVLLSEISSSVISQNGCTISEESLNSFIAYALGSVDAGGDRFYVTDIYIDLKSSDTMCYIRVSRGEISFTVVCECSAEIKNDKIVVYLGEASVGKLPLPEWAMKKLLTQTDLSLSSGEIDADDLIIRFPNHYGLEIADLGEIVSVDIRDLSISDDSVTITTNPILMDSIGNAAERIMDRLGDYFGEFTD